MACVSHVSPVCLPSVSRLGPRLAPSLARSVPPSANHCPPESGSVARNGPRASPVCPPSVLRAHTGGESRALLSGSNVSQILIELVHRYPALRTHLLDDQEMLYPFITIFRNETNIRDLRFLDTELDDGDEVRMLPAVAGG